MTPQSFHLISLGCAKNLVDSEVMFGSLEAAGFTMEPQVEKADFLIVNTCGFLQSAAEEAIAEILELARIKESSPGKKIVVAGCLVQRYQADLARELDEVDLFVGTEGAAHIGSLLCASAAGERAERLVIHKRTLMDADLPRTLTTPAHRAWMKITEGCNNRCSYCMIPGIRGRLRSRTIHDLTAEAKKLEALGVQELSLIAQDSTAYGRDLGKTVNLENLLATLLAETTIPWLRLLYLYPTGITDRLLELMAANRRITPYLDIPFQHVNERILRLMNRPYHYDFLVALVEKIRTRLPDIALRTTFLVGFPGETEGDFLQIEKFLTDLRLDHVGVFAYENEEGCASEHFPGQVEEAEKIRRREHLLAVQAALSAEIQKKYLGRELSVLVEGVCSETDLLLEGRSRYQAPEVDGCVYINDGQVRAGEIIRVKISNTETYDLVGGKVDEDDSEKTA
ncbi:MAG: 30S ribosomal protein S12 methylthiotransferase RimO [Deltaproteobacteria bacterium]|nr:MAG: 30S ribosomal protein S12 methylthiotransferase RimO [Deltaproteobacteria bacterium]